MSDTKKKFTVTILGQEYTIVSDEAEQQVLQAAALINTWMQEIVQKSQGIDPKKVAVLVALQCANRLLEVESHLKTFSKREQQLISLIDHEMQSSL